MARLADALDALSARLTTNDLTFLNWRVTVAGNNVLTEARAWLERQGILPEVSRPGGSRPVRRLQPDRGAVRIAVDEEVRQDRAHAMVLGPAARGGCGARQAEPQVASCLDAAAGDRPADIVRVNRQVQAAFGDKCSDD